MSKGKGCGQKESSESIRQFLREFDDGKRIPIDECKIWGTSSNKYLGRRR
jgi:hypothetical protein